MTGPADPIPEGAPPAKDPAAPEDARQPRTPAPPGGPPPGTPAPGSSGPAGAPASGASHGGAASGAQGGDSKPGAPAPGAAPDGASAGPEALAAEGSPIAAFLAAVRRRPALAVFLFGLVLFTAGLFSIVGNQIGKTADQLPPLPDDRPGGAETPGRVGPAFGEPVGPYIEKKRSTLVERARSNPNDPTLALVVFKEYLTAGAVEQALGNRSLDLLTAQVRIPVRGFKPEEVLLESATLADAAAGMRATVTRELQTLEGIAASVEDPAYRAVYEKDVELHREALGKLTTDPATIFAVVVRSTHSNLAGVNRSAAVRFVDLPDDPTATLEDTTFAALIPEDTETATFAVQ